MAYIKQGHKLSRKSWPDETPRRYIEKVGIDHPDVLLWNDFPPDADFGSTGTVYTPTCSDLIAEDWYIHRLAQPQE
jgi:hypothetical protein